MGAKFGPPQRGKIGTSLSPGTISRQEKTGRLQLDRVLRKAQARCTCTHGERVHTTEGCQMEYCTCTKFKER